VVIAYVRNGHPFASSSLAGSFFVLTVITSFFLTPHQSQISLCPKVGVSSSVQKFLPQHASNVGLARCSSSTLYISFRVSPANTKRIPIVNTIHLLVKLQTRPTHLCARHVRRDSCLGGWNDVISMAGGRKMAGGRWQEDGR
jgi:hypothetical protein